MSKLKKGLVVLLGLLLFMVSSSFFTYVRETEPIQLEHELGQKKEVDKGEYASDEKDGKTEENKPLLYNGLGAYEAYNAVSENDLYVKIRDVGMALIFLIAILGSATLFFLLREKADGEE
ncbi:hypothetical protein [Eubacterium sp. 1001713B170207_170306_E7]|uniref:hypothetical protein n=1 Tax=Eubacterium sp. 1001713B170207_170306_E7 TaxID=2787097 RepID=UPI00189C358B|nr:hypothetical protein [Eubacterium sp. 1001713B170207_170306_E7]